MYVIYKASTVQAIKGAISQMLMTN